MKKSILLTIFGLFYAASASAGVFVVESSANPVGQEQLVLITLKLDSAGDKINAISGSLVFNPINAEVVQIYEGDSVVTSWLEKPKVGSCLPKCQITFSGIIAGGFGGVLSPYYDGARPGKVFSAVIRIKTVGNIDFSIDNAEGYLHDGAGTPVAMSVQSTRINSVSPKPLAAAPDLNDNRAPEPFSVVLGRDKGLFNNKYFIAFNPVDKGSGISKTEVKEGVGEYVSAASPYVLDNQKLGEEILVKATDFAGNETISTIHPAPAPTGSNNIIWGIILVLLVLAVAGRVYETKRKK